MDQTFRGKFLNPSHTLLYPEPQPILMNDTSSRTVPSLSVFKPQSIFFCPTDPQAKGAMGWAEHSSCGSFPSCMPDSVLSWSLPSLSALLPSVAFGTQSSPHASSPSPSPRKDHIPHSLWKNSAQPPGGDMADAASFNGVSDGCLSKAPIDTEWGMKIHQSFLFFLDGLGCPFEMARTLQCFYFACCLFR